MFSKEEIKLLFFEFFDMLYKYPDFYIAEFDLNINKNKDRKFTLIRYDAFTEQVMWPAIKSDLHTTRIVKPSYFKSYLHRNDFISYYGAKELQRYFKQGQYDNSNKNK